MILLLAGKLSFAQVGIGTSVPHASSALDISSTSKGLLLPRMTTVQRNAIATPATGLIVFDTTLNGFYGYDGTTWTQSVFSPLSWNLNGNAGVNSATQFIGTTDDNSLTFRVSNREMMTIANDGNVRLSGANITRPRLAVTRPTAGTRHASIYAEVSNDATSSFPINYTTANVSSGRIRGNYSFATNSANASAGVSAAGMAYDVTSSRVMFYTGGHPTSINDDSLGKFFIYNNGTVGIGTPTPSAAKLTVQGDIYLNAVGNGVVMKSPDGNCWKVQVSDAGVLSSVSVTCP